MSTFYRLQSAALILAVCLLTVPVAVTAATDLGKTAGSMAEQATSVVEKLNINTASVDALAGIPGIGPKVGEAITAYRDAHGAFTSLSDLVNVEGIDAALLEKIKPFLTL